MKNEQQIRALVAERNYILMFMEEVEQADTFWLWHKYSSRHRHEEAEWGYHFKMFLIAALHCSLLSVRKLNDFFTGSNGKPDDVKADRLGFQNMTQPVSTDLVKKLNKYLAHMTLPGAELRFIDWDMDDFTHPIFQRSLEFCQHLERSFLEPKMDAEILQQVASFKRGLQARVKRGTRN